MLNITGLRGQSCLTSLAWGIKWVILLTIIRDWPEEIKPDRLRFQQASSIRERNRKACLLHVRHETFLAWRNDLCLTSLIRKSLCPQGNMESYILQRDQRQLLIGFPFCRARCRCSPSRYSFMKTTCMQIFKILARIEPLGSIGFLTLYSRWSGPGAEFPGRRFSWFFISSDEMETESHFQTMQQPVWRILYNVVLVSEHILPSWRHRPSLPSRSSKPQFQFLRTASEDIGFSRIILAVIPTFAARPIVPNGPGRKSSFRYRLLGCVRTSRITLWFIGTEILRLHFWNRTGWNRNVFMILPGSFIIHQLITDHVLFTNTQAMSVLLLQPLQYAGLGELQDFHQLWQYFIVDNSIFNHNYK